MRGHISRRGKSSWRLKFDIGRDANGKRQIRYVTVRGKRADAERELARLINDLHNGVLVDPAKVTVEEYIRKWLDGPHGLANKTAERYLELGENQIFPTLGHVLLQRLRPSDVKSWHEYLLKDGRKHGGPLSARTVGHAHRVLHRALQVAVKTEVLARNVASAVPPPKVEADEIEILDQGEVATLLDGLQGHWLHPIAAVDLATGLRRGEVLGLQWDDIDLDGASLRVERALEETKRHGLQFKPPKTKHGRRTLSLPPSAVTVLREHRVKQLEMRLALGLGKPPGDALVFSRFDGSPIPPRQLTKEWAETCASRGLPRVTFHALRHTHASALIAAGLDVVMISRRLGHANPTVTLNIYGHLFRRNDDAAAHAIESVLQARPEC